MTVEERINLRPVVIDAFDLGDAWFQCLTKIFIYGHIYTVKHGSFKGQQRIEFDYIVVHIKKPSNRPIIPLMPEGASIPPPTSMEYVEQYLNYLLTSEKQEGEDYTYGERLVDPKVITREKGDGKKMIKEMPLQVNQIDEVIKMYKEKGFETNQAIMEIGMPSDIKLSDPPCLRIVDTRVRYNKLHFILYFRSWDLWAGFPSNLAALQLLKEHMAEEIGVEDGEIIAASKGLHLYDHSWEVAKCRVGRIDG